MSNDPFDRRLSVPKGQQHLAVGFQPTVYERFGYKVPKGRQSDPDCCRPFGTERCTGNPFRRLKPAATCFCAYGTVLPSLCFSIAFLVSIITGCAKTETPPTAQFDAQTEASPESRQSETTSDEQPATEVVPPAQGIRFATFNVALNRFNEGDLKAELIGGKSDAAQQIAEIIQRVRPDVLLINEFDYDQKGQGIESFRNQYLAVSQNGQPAIEYPHMFFDTVNTGVDSGVDLNMDGKKGTADDAFGFGQFPGKYGMVVLSRLPIDEANIRTFQNFLWKDMPDAMWPVDAASGQPFYNDEVQQVFRLSSKSHWDVPVEVDGKTIHFLVSHPTPPVFDGPEDRNGRRNHDEIRIWADYISNQADYLYDDAGSNGGLPEGAHFVIAGDLNADPEDGDTADNAAGQLIDHLLINSAVTPASEGGVYYAEKQGQMNASHKGDPAADTGDFNDQQVGNMRIDYCLPSKTLELNQAGVFWPKPDQPGGDLVSVSDHRMVWVDVQ